jgi:hypothetical protein
VKCQQGIRWRRAICWIAAYALALQLALQNVLVGPPVSPLGFADQNDGAQAIVLCHHDDDGVASSEKSPDQSKGSLRCGHCCLGMPPLLEPPTPPLLGRVLSEARELHWPIADWRNLIAFGHPSQPARGPPHSA